MLKRDQIRTLARDIIDVATHRDSMFGDSIDIERLLLGLDINLDLTMVNLNSIRHGLDTQCKTYSGNWEKYKLFDYMVEVITKGEIAKAINIGADIFANTP